MLLFRTAPFGSANMHTRRKVLVVPAWIGNPFVTAKGRMALDCTRGAHRELADDHIRWHPAELLALRGVRESIAELIAIQITSRPISSFCSWRSSFSEWSFGRTRSPSPSTGSFTSSCTARAFGYVVIADRHHRLAFRLLPIRLAPDLRLHDGHGRACRVSAHDRYPILVHAYASFLVAGFLLALAIYAFKTSLGSRAAFKDLLGEA